MISFELPWLLLLLPLPLLVWGLAKPCQPHISALTVPFFARLQGVFSSASFSVTRNAWRWWCVLIIWFCLVLASTHPVWLGQPIAIERSGRAVMLAVDLSGSMKQRDMRWQGQAVRRVDIVKKVASEFIAKRQGDRLGLILFGSNAYLQTPLTFDRKTVQDMLNDASLGLAGPYTAIGDAIGLAVKSFAKTPDHEKVLVLLTDGANNAGHVTPQAMAKIAAEKNIRIYTIGLGANQIERETFFGTQVINPSQDLDEKSLHEISQVTGGLFFRAASTQDLQQVYRQLNRLEPVQDKKAFLQPKQPFYPWLLGLALLLVTIVLWPLLAGSTTWHARESNTDAAGAS